MEYGERMRRRECYTLALVLQMKQFIVDVLNVTTAIPNKQSVVYSKHFEQYEGVHVGFVVFNETVCDTF